MATNLKIETIIQALPLFATLTHEQVGSLTNKMEIVTFPSGTKIVNENDLVDSVYILLSGQVEVTREIKHKKKLRQIPVATLRAGEAIGLNDIGFFSESGKRTASVTVIKDCKALRLDIKDLNEFLQHYHLEGAMYQASSEMLMMRFIKQSLPFAKLSHDRLRWLASKVHPVSYPAGSYVFKQGDVGDKCYLIRSGKLEIIGVNTEGEEQQLAVLKPPVLFGEATLMSGSPRNASARVLEDSELLVLEHAQLSELIESEQNVATMFMTLMIDRSRPQQNPHVSAHPRTTADKQEVTILKNPDNGNYFKLSKEGSFIWEEMDGKKTLQDITLNLAEQHNIFAPDVVAGIVSKLSKAGFINNIDVNETATATLPRWIKSLLAIKKILEFRVAFGDANQWITKTYNQYIRYLFSSSAQFFLLTLMVLGFATFIMSTKNVLGYFAFHHTSLLLILCLLPFSLLVVVLHELGHAYAVKAFNREVHYIGVGWYWFGPVAFTDTSDMWLSGRKQRMWVNLAGIYVDVLIAGVTSLFIIIIPYPWLQSLLWLFALYTYLGAFRMLSPLQEMDGYYILMDWVEKPRLRQAAVIWLVKKLPESVRNPSLLKKYKPEVIYWLACLLYIFFISLITLTVMHFVLSIVGMHSNPYLSLSVPFLVVIFSCLGIIADIRSQE